jgi:hypothetical protein
MPLTDGSKSDVGKRSTIRAGSETEQVTLKFNRSRAKKESYRAKLMQTEYEKTIGELVHREGVTAASFRIGRTLRDALIALPNRLAPAVSIETDQKKVYSIIEKEVTAIIVQLVHDLSQEQK